MSDVPELTILLGPMTAVSVTINGIVRKNSQALADAGVVAYASRTASPILRRHLGDKPAEARALAFYEETPNRPAFLSALNFFGPPPAALKAGAFFPNAQASIEGLHGIAPRARFILCIDRLANFFLTLNSEPLEARVRRTSWDLLYEISWAALARDIKEAVPEGALVVLTPEGAGASGARALQRLFGQAADVLPDPHALLRAQISETGHAVLDRLIASDDMTAEMLLEVQKTFAITPSQADLSERLGLDKVTAALLDQRYLEDVDAIRTLPDTEVI